MPDDAFAAASWRDPDFWRRIAPLGIGSPPRRKRKRPADDADADAPQRPADDDAADAPQRPADDDADETPQFARDGFATLRGNATTAALAARCADAIELLAARGLPAACIFLYDEAWALVAAFAPRLAALLADGAAMNYDCYAFRVAPGARGWAAHRDRAGDDARAPGYATCWVALTDCGPDTACVRAAPLRATEGLAADDPRALEEAAARAAVPLALRRGDAAAWAGRTVHFGGPHADATRPPRAALAFAASTPALEDDRDRIEAVRAWAGGAGALPFDARLKLVALQLEFYADAEPLDPRVRTVLDALDAAWCGD